MGSFSAVSRMPIKNDGSGVAPVEWARKNGPGEHGAGECGVRCREGVGGTGPDAEQG